ncbi:MULTISPECIES: DUF4395 domain-containing protein [unclassified Spirosoma]|uniref:DUF4395 domain-containing protein n=1 Tax=unclassified Spirosoma TaxID=2621999 RepID=UPI0009615700|nr:MULTISPECIES: DUF4395 domain-containing protein [unclassified Spirosoma]MBN8825976.1 DUF4395 domain-containing protein [Spirosoma sp.]OJW71006.1 MAG: hypothetical protein BGO59_32855 [Spirosoma sp. 48-14]
MSNQIICPTSGVQINETKVRLVAGLVLLIAVVYLLTNWLALPLLLFVDFGLRSTDLGKYSPLGTIADGLVNTFHLPYKGTDQAPKQFAARIGFGFAILIMVLHIAGVSTLLAVSVLAVFAALESIVGFCAGCYVYTYYLRLFAKVND